MLRGGGSSEWLHESTHFDPMSCRVHVTCRKVLDLGRHKVRRQVLCDIAQGRCGDQCNLLDVLLMVPNEAEVRHHCSKTLPSRKRRRINDQAIETSVLSDVGVDGSREFRKVGCLERGLRPQVQNGVHFVECMFENEMFLSA